MGDDSSQSASRNQRLEEVIAETLEAEAAGNTPDRQQLLKRHPDLSDELAAFFADHDRMKDVAAPLRAAADAMLPLEPGTPEDATLPPKPAGSDMATLPPDGTITAPPPGTKVRYFGDYELLEEIARGGMGVVYKARQVSLNRIVALKMILAGQLATDDDVKRFLTEAEAAANLDHPGIVPIFEVGQYEGQHYFSMAFVEGQSLAAKVAEGPLPPSEAAKCVRLLAEAVEYAHDKGVIHRDLKPANVLLEKRRESTAGSSGKDHARSDSSSSDARHSTLDARPRITDFGLAKRTTGDSHLTSTGQILGTPSYMPPEQAAGKLEQVGPASDVYSLGAILYCLLTGRPPFQSANPMDTLLQVLDQEPISPRQLNPNVPRDLETICRKCLEKLVNRRYASAQELADELQRFLNGEPILARPISTTGRAWRWCKRKPVVAGLTALAAVSLVAGTGVSSYFAILAKRQAAEAMEARDDATEKLLGSYLAQAQALRWSGKAGRRFDSLDVLAKAAEIRPSLELRNEAIACMALADLRLANKWTLDPPGPLVAFDTTLDRYARADRKGNISVRRVSDDRELLWLPGPSLPLVWILRFSPDGRLLAAKFEDGQTSQVQIWDLEQQRVVFTVPLPISFGAVDFSADSRRLAFAQPDGSVHIYDIATWTESSRLSSSIPQPYSATFDPHARRLAVSGHRVPIVELLDLETGEGKKALRHAQGARGVWWSPDGAILATAGSDHHVYLWDAAAGECIHVLQGHTNVVTHVAFSRAGDVLVSYAWGGTTQLWDSVRGKPLVSIQGEFLNFSADDGHLAFKIAPYEAGIWEVTTGREYGTLGQLAEGTIGADAAISPDGLLMATVDAAGVRLWDLPKSKQVASLPQVVSSVAFHPQGNCLLTAGKLGLFRWPLQADQDATGGRIRVGPPTPIGPPHHMQRVAVNADGHILGAVGGGHVYGLALGENGETAKTVLHGRHANGESVSVSPDGRWIATGNWKGTGVKVWGVQTGKLVRDLPVVGNALVAFSPDGRWLVTSSGESYRFWQVGSWGPAREVTRDAPSDVPGSTVFSPDSKVLAISEGSPQVRLIAPETGSELARLAADPQVALCFHPDGTQLVVVGEERLIRIWELRRIRKQLAAMNLDWDLPPYP